MDKIQRLVAESLATHTLLVHFFRELLRTDPALRETIRLSFDEAASNLESRGIALSKGTGPADYIVEALGIIEDMRTAVLGDPGKPKGLV